LWNRGNGQVCEETENGTEELDVCVCQDGNRPAEYMAAGNSASWFFVCGGMLPEVDRGVSYGREGFQFLGINSAIRLAG
jgi:hypothetical protein